MNDIADILTKHRLWLEGEDDGMQADLRMANLRMADLSQANLSGAVGLLSQSDFMEQFETDAAGWVVYKRIGKTAYDMPAQWVIAPGEYLTEVCDAQHCTD